MQYGSFPFDYKQAEICASNKLLEEISKKKSTKGFAHSIGTTPAYTQRYCISTSGDNVTLVHAFLAFSQYFLQQYL